MSTTQHQQSLKCWDPPQAQQLQQQLQRGISMPSQDFFLPISISLPSVRPPPTQASSPEPIVPGPALSELQTQLHDTQSLLASHVDKARALEGVFAEHEAIKREVSLLRSLVEGANGSSKEDDEEFANEDDDDARSICTVIPHKLERVEEEDEEQAEQQEADEVDEERRRRRSKLGRPRTPEPTHLGMPHSEDEEEQHERSQPRPVSPTKPTMMIEDLTERLTALAAHRRHDHHLGSRIKVAALETLVKNSQQAPPPVIEARPPPLPPQPESESLTQMPADWKKTVEGQRSSVREERATERERLASAREEWESKVKSVKSNLGNTAARLDTRLAARAVLQRQWRGNVGVWARKGTRCRTV
ncbi:hypothetical protein HWV62_9857 [Athelia sp. TMB]|nr:hypothetical protein HWV62_9857 [Athelia sp. TMB]